MKFLYLFLSLLSVVLSIESSKNEEHNDGSEVFVKPRRTKAKNGKKSNTPQQNTKKSKKTKSDEQTSVNPSVSFVPSFSPSSSQMPSACIKPPSEPDYILVGDTGITSSDCTDPDPSNPDYNPNNQDLLSAIAIYETTPCLQVGNRILVDIHYGDPDFSVLLPDIANGLKPILDNAAGTEIVDINSSSDFLEGTLDVSVYMTLIMILPDMPLTIHQFLRDFMRQGGRVIFFSERSGDTITSVNFFLGFVGGDTIFGTTVSSANSDGNWIESATSNKDICLGGAVGVVEGTDSILIAQYKFPTPTPVIVADTINRL